MMKLATTFELALPPNNSRLAAYRWLYASLRDEILHGRLRPGARLPSTRDFASQYGLARGTIVNAFEQLKSEGYLAGSMGSVGMSAGCCRKDCSRCRPSMPQNRQCIGKAAASGLRLRSAGNAFAGLRDGDFAPSGPTCQR